MAGGAIQRPEQLHAAARRGEEAAFQRLVEPYRRELYAHCYRMTGSVQDAEDALQDALVRAWRAIGRQQEPRALRAWLYRIATNTSLDLIKRRPDRVLPFDHGGAGDPHDGPGPPLNEIAWIEPYPDEQGGLDDAYASPDARYELRETVELAFIAALQHLPARQRAVLVLREALGFSAQEVADLLDTTVASVNSALQRARASVEDRLPDASQQATLKALGDQKLREIVDGYVAAWERGDVEAVVSMLAEDATMAMPPMALWFRGRDACEVFLREWAFGRRWAGERFEEGERDVQLVVTTASGQPAIGAYRRDGDTFRPYALQVLTFRPDGKLADITAFVSPQIFPAYGLPETLPAE